MTIVRFALLFILGVVIGLSAACTRSNDLGGGGDPASPSPDGGAVGPFTASGARYNGEGCPAYQRRCNGACIPVSDDPKNCGGCGVVCASDKVCSGGACTGSCLPGLTACAQACVDIDTDNANCGACGKACAAGLGCVAGTCVEAVATTKLAGGACDNGGPAVQIDTGTKTECAGDLAQATFRWAICSCNSIGHSGDLVTDGFDSTQGPYVPGGGGAGIGLNGEYGTSGFTDVHGAMWCGGAAGIGTSNTLLVSQELHSAGPVHGSGDFHVVADAYVVGDVQSTTGGTIGGKLFTPAGTDVRNVTAAEVVRQPVTVSPPCDCAESQKIPVAAIVAQGKLHNDNDKIGLAADALEHGTRRLDLPCGKFFLTSVGTSSPQVIAVHGHTALFIEGDIGSSNSVSITVDATASLDLFIGGEIGSSDQIHIGSPNHPALVRTYVAGTHVGGSGDMRFAGNLYAINANAGWSSMTEFYGSLIVNDVGFSGDMKVHYDRQVLNSGRECGTPSTPSMPTAPTAPPCQTNTDCPAPLICNAGTCQVVIL